MKLIKLCRYTLKNNIVLKIEDSSNEMTKEQAVQLKAVTLFQNIDSLGNYTNSNWFMDLNRYKLLKFINELIDIWEHRANLTKQLQESIYPPYGKPFGSIRNKLGYYTDSEEEYDVNDLRNDILIVINKIVNKGITRDNKCLGAYYVLGALTLVSQDAAASIPWLYESVRHI